MQEIIAGLSAADVVRIRASGGFNELSSAKARSPIIRILRILTQPMFLLLIIAGVVSMILAEPLDAAVLLVMVFGVMAITIYQEGRAEKALGALSQLAAPKANVLRDGEWETLPARELVVGDICRIHEGDRIPADVELLETTNLLLDESMLTGESLPVAKTASESAFGGALVNTGRAIGRVIAIGQQTELGKIGASIAQAPDHQTQLQQDVNKIVKIVGVIAGLLAIAITLILGFTRTSWLDAVLAGIASAMAMIPEEIPVVLTLFFAIGAWRMSQEKVLTRKSAVIETLGSATVICVDKTGTLTLNQLSVDELIQDPSATELKLFAGLASPIDSVDAVDRAFNDLAEGATGRSLVKEYPMTADTPAMTMVWDQGDNYLVAMKGAPETVAELCGFDAQAVLQNVQAASAGGKRIIGVAGLVIPKGELPKDQSDFKLKFQGLVALRDTVRPGVPGAIAQCHEAGIRVIMITGDFIGTAREIAVEVGLADTGELTGAELDSLSDEELAIRVKTLSVCARMTPAHKLRLVQALQATGEVVAMTGDGVNDAPALKTADISIAMGLRGTDVAREAATLIITDDDFTSIVAGIRRGRAIYAGIRKSVAYIIAVHVPLLGMALIPILTLDWPIILLPAMVAFLEIIIDPACTIVFQAEPPEPEIMKRKPRPVAESLFNFETLGISLIQGAVVLLAVLAQYFWLVSLGRPADEVRSATLILMVLSNLALILTNRSWNLSLVKTMLTRKNPSVKWILGLTLLGLFLLTQVEVAAQAFNLGPTTVWDWVLGFVLAVASILWFEVYKVLTLAKRMD